MSDEATIEKYDRVRVQIQNLVLKAYPNPRRNGCSIPLIAEYARRAADFEAVHGEPEYEHIMHCSPCYAEFLAAREDIRAQRGKPDSDKRLPRKRVKRMDKPLAFIEKILKEG
jgi:hypothetical protein